MRIRLIRAGGGQFQVQELELPAGATVADALAATELPREGLGGYAVFGERVEPETALADGDRLELLEPLLADPKDSRRRRAQVQAARARPR